MRPSTPAPPLPASTPDPDVAAARRRRPWRWAAWASVAALGAAASLLLAGWLTLQWGFLPRLQAWVPELEARSSRVLGAPVRIGELGADLRGLRLHLRLRDVQVLDAAGTPALMLPRVDATLSPLSVLGWPPRLDHLQIDDPALELRRDALGRVFVGGIEVGEGGADLAPPPGAADWLLSQRQVVIRRATLRWVDEARVAPPLVLRELGLVMRNSLRQHDMRLEATPPPAWGEPFSLTGRFTQSLLARPSDWRRWDGIVYADLPTADVEELRRHVGLPIEIRQGRGALRAWVEWRDGAPVAATVDAGLRSVSVRLAPTLEPLEFEQVQGRLVARRHPGGVSVEADDFGFTTAEGIVWSRGDARVAWRQRQDGPDGGAGQPVTGGEFSAERLDLAVMARIGSRLPLGDALHRLLDTLEPQGLVTSLAGRWDGPLDAPWRYQVKGQAADLSLAAGAVPPSGDRDGLGRPGISNANVTFSATERGGEATLAMTRGRLTFPGVFDEPVLPLQQLDAQLDWRIEPIGLPDSPPRVAVQVRGARLANADLRGSVDARWQTGPGEGLGSGGRWPGRLELDARITGARLERVARYLPRALSRDARDYLQASLVSGEIGATTIRVAGDLWDFPFAPAPSARTAPPRGEFRIAGPVRRATFAYVPPTGNTAAPGAATTDWPVMTDVQAEVVIDRAELSIRDASARIGAVRLSEVQGGIADLGADPVLAIRGMARGTMQDLLGFVAASPVRAWTEQALDPITATGDGTLDLALQLPLDRLDDSTVRGTVRLDGNDVRLGAEQPVLGGARGRVEFSETGFRVAPTVVRVAGGEATVEGGSQPGGALRFTAQGVASAEGLRNARELGLPGALTRALVGQTPYQLQLAWTAGALDWTLTSPLSGLAVQLPPPLAKPADTSLPLRIELSGLPPDAAGGRAVTVGETRRDQLRVELGELLQARYVREHRDGATRVVRGALAVQDRLVEPPDGMVAARLRLPVLNLDAWRSHWARQPEAAAATPAGALPYLPQDIGLQVGELRLYDRRLDEVALRAFGRDGRWRADVQSRQVAGQFDWVDDAAGERLRARLARLALPRSEVAAVEQLLEAPPRPLPALDVVVEDFMLRERRLGRLEIEATNRLAADGQRDWRLARLQLANPDARFSATGVWSLPAPTATGAAAGGRDAQGPGRSATTLDFRLDVADSGLLLERLGQGGAMRGGQGRLAGQISWDGSPLDPRFATMTGQMTVALDAGQFLKVDPGAARLLGVLSLQALPRRLALDFRDVFDEGFAFDSITGDVRVEAGVAHTNNLRMRGLQAAVLMDGSADLKAETQQLRVVVVPEINAGTASLAYAAINPAIGLGTFLAQVFLRRPLAEAGTREFRISGPWADPKVERVQRPATGGPPESEAAAGQPGARSTQ
jgi:uncharacterized protein (TIGR02099 family)